VLSFRSSCRCSRRRSPTCSALARVHAEELARHYWQAAKRSGAAGKLHAGAVTFVQRFGSSLNLHVPPPRHPLTRFHGVLAPRAKLRPRVVPKTPRERRPRVPLDVVSAPGQRRAAGPAVAAYHNGGGGASTPSRPYWACRACGVARLGDDARSRGIDGAVVPSTNVLSARDLGRIGGGRLDDATSNVPWATLLALTFDLDVKGLRPLRRHARRPRCRHRPHDRAQDPRGCPEHGAGSALRRHPRRLRTCVRVTRTRTEVDLRPATKGCAHFQALAALHGDVSHHPGFRRSTTPPPSRYDFLCSANLDDGRTFRDVTGASPGTIRARERAAMRALDRVPPASSAPRTGQISRS